MPNITVRRSQLYAEVWTEPMVSVAKRYGLSDVGLAKTCRRYDIPRPTRGYWQQKEAGQSVSPTPLPNPRNDYDVHLRDTGRHLIKSGELKAELEKLAEAEALPEAQISVAEDLRGSHSLVRQTNHELQRRSPDEFGIIPHLQDDALHVRVSKGALHRALLIMDALLMAFDKRGYETLPGPRIKGLGTAVGFSISEATVIVRQEPKDHNLEGSYTFGHSLMVQKRVPSGLLALQINDEDAWFADGCRRLWKDGQSRRIEQSLNAFVAGVLEVAACKADYEAEKRKEEIARQERERAQQEVARRKAERRPLILAERGRVADLLEQSTDWRHSKELREYIEARRQAHLAQHGSVEETSEFRGWLVWALQQADRLDPFVASPPSILDEDDGIDDKQNPSAGGLWGNR